MKTLGIDFATEPGNAAYCVLDWSGSVPRVLQAPIRPKSWSDLQAWIPCVEKAGIDVPLGWPEPFAIALSAHARKEPWTADRRVCLMRSTDLVVALTKDPNGGRARAPLSVSANLIGATAMEAAAMLSRYEVDRSGASGVVCEVYPAVALRRWGLPDVGYKGLSPEAAETRRRIVDGLVTGLSWLGDWTETIRLMNEKDDYLDAFVCALLARLVTLDRCQGPSTAEEQRLAAVEGWIWIPEVGSLSALTDSTQPVRLATA